MSMAESMLGFLNADCRHMNNKRYLRFKKHLLRNFWDDATAQALIKLTTKVDIELFYSRCIFEYDKGNMIFNEWSKGFIEGYLAAKYGDSLNLCPSPIN